MLNLDKLEVDEVLFYAIATSIIAKAEISANGLDGKERIGIYLDSENDVSLFVTEDLETIEVVIGNGIIESYTKDSNSIFVLAHMVKFINNELEEIETLEREVE